MANEYVNWVVTVEFTVRPGHADSFIERLTTQAADSLLEPGCSQFDVCVDPSDEHRLRKNVTATATACTMVP